MLHIMENDELRIVAAMLEDPMAWHYSLGVGSMVGFAAGGIYPIFAKLEGAGWLESRWEPSNGGTPRRRVYRLSGLGQRRGAAALADRQAVVQAPSPRRRLGLPEAAKGFG